MVRYAADGKKLDAGFGNDGKVTTDFGSLGVEEPLGLAIQPDGKIVLAGVSTRETTSSDFAVARNESIANAEAIEEIGAIAEGVKALLAAGVLNNGQANSLQSKLDDAVQLFEDDKITPAAHQLEDFISEVSNFIDNGTLTSAQGQPLIDAAEEVLDQLVNDPLMAGVDAVFSEFDLLEELLGV